LKFEVYCDESYPDLLLSKKPTGKFLVIGSLWLESGIRKDLKELIHELREQHKIGPEFKWHKINSNRVNFYLDLVPLLFSFGDQLRFRCIAVEYDKVNLIKYHDNDAELGFYKFYYQLLKHWILDFNDYSIFCDSTKNRGSDRLHSLRRYLQLANLTANITNVQAISSADSVLIQFSDVLTGAASARLNDQLNKSSAKESVVLDIEKRLGNRIAPIGPSEKKFNIFRISLDGGW